tara:strand:+ start:577 stop:759 length:183 start_codon:yes stop_codon:yes gene_type:complete
MYKKEELHRWALQDAQEDNFVTYTNLERAEKLLKSIKDKGSHHQIKEEIDKYFKEKKECN